MFGPAGRRDRGGHGRFRRDQVNLNGTFVPLFGVNNLFSQMPVLGPILGRRAATRGCSALNYRITGSAAQPVLNVNPLSALAPGFLRKIFGAIDDSALTGAGRAPALGQGGAGTTDPSPSDRTEPRGAREPLPLPSRAGALAAPVPRGSAAYSGFSSTCFLRPSDSLIAAGREIARSEDRAVVGHGVVVDPQAAALDLPPRLAGRGHEAGADEGRQHAEAGLEFGRAGR